MHRLLCILLCCTFTLLVSADEPSPVPEEIEAGEGHYLWALASAELSNLVLFSFNYFIAQADFSQISPSTIRHNLSAEWQWDQSMFQTNQIGHPYHGSTYFAAGKSAGLSFYESTLLTALGSATWEIFCERCEPALNDLIVTTVGGVSLGEITHRLYREAEGHPLSFLISPMDALTDRVLDDRPLPGTDNLTALAVRSGVGVSVARRYEAGVEETDYGRETPIGGAGLSLSYGDPFVHRTSEPFSQFDFDLSVSGGMRLFNTTLMTDGFLFAFPIEDSPRLRATTGVTLHYDFYYGNLLGFSANSLLLSVKAAAPVGESGLCTLKAHAGWLGIGVAEYTPSNMSSLEENHDYRLSYGTGIQAKLDFSIGSPTFGTFDITGAGYLAWSIPGTAPEADGLVACTYIRKSYLRPVSDRLDIGIASDRVLIYGFWDELPRSDRSVGEATIFVKWDLLC